MADFAHSNTTALDAANYILELADAEKRDIDSLMLQKILFFCQCWALHDGARLFDDRVEAWKHGPVVRAVWKAYGGGDIPRPSTSRFYELSGDQMELIQGVWESLKGFSGPALSKQTHEPGSAWRKTRGSLPDTSNSDREIAPEDMAQEAAKVHQSIQARLVASWDDLVACQT